jgi:hypothetical protein
MGNGESAGPGGAGPAWAGAQHGQASIAPTPPLVSVQGPSQKHFGRPPIGTGGSSGPPPWDHGRYAIGTGLLRLETDRGKPSSPRAADGSRSSGQSTFSCPADTWIPRSASSTRAGPRRGGRSHARLAFASGAAQARGLRSPPAQASRAATGRIAVPLRSGLGSVPAHPRSELSQRSARPSTRSGFERSAEP